MVQNILKTFMFLFYFYNFQEVFTFSKKCPLFKSWSEFQRKFLFINLVQNFKKYSVSEESLEFFKKIDFPKLITALKIY